MRRLFIAPLVAVFAFACADVPSAPLLEPTAARFAEWEGEPPPPWAVVYGGGTVENNPYSFIGHFFINKPGNVAWLAFSDAGEGTFSPSARIMNVNGKVIGVGTLTVGGETYQLSQITTFDANRDCMSSPAGRASCGSFSGGDFAAGGGFTWTGQMANDRIKRIGKPGDGFCTIACDGILTKP